MTTFRYGEENLAAAPDNTSGLIDAVHLRDLIVSNRSGGVQILETTPFTVPITNGVPVSINPLLPAPTVAGVLWSADANNRAFPNYAAAIPSATIPVGYVKFTQILFSFNGEKAGAGTDDYLFRVDLDGVPQGTGVTVSYDSNPAFTTIVLNRTVDIGVQPLVGLTVTGVGTGDDIDINAFEMMVFDFQVWSAP